MAGFGVKYRDSVDPTIDPMSVAGALRNRRPLPQMEETSSVGTVSLFDALITNLWQEMLGEYSSRGVGWNLAGENTIPYPDKEVWWDDPRSRLDLLREYYNYVSEEDLKQELLLNQALENMEKSIFEYKKEMPERRRGGL